MKADSCQQDDPNGCDCSASASRFSRRGFLGVAVTSAVGAGFAGAGRLFAGQTTPSPFSVQTPLPRPKIREYRTLGRTEAKVSDIGFGGGNLNNAGVLAVALDAGMNYIDTAEHYGRGNSERTIGDVLRGRDRKSVFLTTKLNLKFGPSATKEDLRARFLKCLERLRTDHADCLMIHACDLDQVKHESYHELIRELKAEGKVRFSGLSNHGADYALHGPASGPMDEVFLAAVEDGRFDVGLFVYNFLKSEMGEKILKVCQAKGMGMTLMKTNPAKSLATEKRVLQSAEERAKAQGQSLPESIAKLKAFTEDRAARMDALMKKHGLAGTEQVRDAAVKFCLSHPHVHTVCPSLNTFEELDAYLSLSGTKMDERAAALLSGYAEVFGPFYCRHACGVCESACPHGVPVNTIMRYNHYFRAQGREKMAMSEYASLGARNASPCAGCSGACAQACPHGVPIPGLLALAHETLTP